MVVRPGLYTFFPMLVGLILEQPIEFQAEIALNNQFLGDTLHSVSPEKFNLTNSSIEGQNTIIIKGKVPFVSVFTWK